jgi:hypothetical protein
MEEVKGVNPRSLLIKWDDSTEVKGLIFFY